MAIVTIKDGLTFSCAPDQTIIDAAQESGIFSNIAVLVVDVTVVRRVLSKAVAVCCNQNCRCRAIVRR